jgi:predicted O-methyltransferase YrrM
MPGPLREHVRALRYRYGLLAPTRVRARQAERSMIYSADDEQRPSARLLALARDAAEAAQRISLEHLDERLPDPPYWHRVWPGEHYRLLAGLVEAERPSVVIEIGTATGLSALALLHRLPAEARLVTFDLVPWREYPGAVLREDDFADGRLTQELDDLSAAAGADKHRELLEAADLIFVDAAKDGRQEQNFLDRFDRTAFRGAPLVVFDDIRQWKMLGIWRHVRRPKLDVTSFGHWSGTGLVDFAPGAVTFE